MKRKRTYSLIRHAIMKRWHAARYGIFQVHNEIDGYQEFVAIPEPEFKALMDYTIRSAFDRGKRAAINEKKK